MFLAAVGLALLLAGPIIRLPLKRTANRLVYLGLVICAIAILWFLIAILGQWSPQTGQPTIIGLYSVGLLVMAVGGVVVPILTDRADLGAQVSDLEAALAALRETLEATELDEAELADVVDDLRRSLAKVQAESGDLTDLVEDLRAGIVDTEADEADLAAQLRSLRRSQNRFELYENRSEGWRWRLRHRNGNILADSGEGYADRSGAWEAIKRVKRNTPAAPFEETE